MHPPEMTMHLISLSDRSCNTTIVLFDEVKRKESQITALWVKNMLGWTNKDSSWESIPKVYNQTWILSPMKLGLNQKQNWLSFMGRLVGGKTKSRQGISSYKDGAVALQHQDLYRWVTWGKNEVDAVLSNYEDPSAAQFRQMGSSARSMTMRWEVTTHKIKVSMTAKISTIEHHYQLFFRFHGVLTIFPKLWWLQASP